MRLKHNRPCPYDLSPLPSVITRCANLIKSAMGSRQGVCLRQSALAGGSPGPIDINHDPLLTGSVKQATGRKKRLAGQQILLKGYSERFHTGLIQCRKKTR